MWVSVIAVFDIGKTNKKLFLFDEDYNIVLEKSVSLAEIIDDEGDLSEDLDALIRFVHESLREVLNDHRFKIKAVNFSAYGASFVYIDNEGHPVFPLYNYLKLYPEEVHNKFHNDYGDEDSIALCTASPNLGSLNSGLQVYRLKHQYPEKFSKVKYALHLPQFVSSIISNQYFSEITSLGCHTMLLDFEKLKYHDWVYAEGLDRIFATIVSSNHAFSLNLESHEFMCGVGLHDSSAALIPYLNNFQEPFVLISTGTWCISLNPFNQEPLTKYELEQDCLCYTTFEGKPVKASRLFSGYEYEREVKRIAAHFGKAPSDYYAVKYEGEFINELFFEDAVRDFSSIDLSVFADDLKAYHRLVFTLAMKQWHSTNLILRGADVSRILVDGGFARNEVFMNVLARLYRSKEVYASFVSQGTALGAALAIHEAWNSKPLPGELLGLVRYGESALAR